MTYSLGIKTLATSISNLSVSGVTIKDIDEIVTSWKPLPAVLYPMPNGWVTNLSVKVDTLGTMGNEKLTVSYDLTYRYLHVQIGALTFAMYSDMMTNIVAIANAIMSNDTLSGAVDIRLKTIANLGPVVDPAGNSYHGCDMIFAVEEYL